MQDLRELLRQLPIDHRDRLLDRIGQRPVEFRRAFESLIDQAGQKILGPIRFGMQLFGFFQSFALRG